MVTHRSSSPRQSSVAGSASLFTLAALFFFSVAHAQPAGTPDPAWTPTPLPVQGDGTWKPWMPSIIQQSDGKIAAAVIDSAPASTGLARFLPSGALDTSLDGDGLASASIDTFGIYAFDIALAPDGRYYLSGFAHNPNVTALFVERRLADGRLDPGFGGSGQVRYAASSSLYSAERMLRVQADGKVLLMGFVAPDYFGTGYNKIHVVRFNVDGSLDTSFGTGGVVQFPLANGLGNGTSLHLAPDGSIFVLGHDYEQSGGFVIKLTASGAPDPGFGVSGKVGGQPNNGFTAMDLAIQDDGKLVVAGRYRGLSGLGLGLIRLFPNGALDYAFANGGIAFHDPTPGDDYSPAVSLDRQGRILVAVNLNVQPGPFGYGLVFDSVALARFLPSGAPDKYFGQGGYIMPPGERAFDLELDASGDFVYLLTADDRPPLASLIHKYSVRNSPPTVTLLTGGRTLLDTDGIAGEMMTLRASASDPDGIVVSTEWVVDGVAAGTGTTLTLALPDGSHSVGFRATDNEGAVSAVSEPYTIVAPTQPLPRMGCRSGVVECKADFALSLRDQNGALVTSAALGQPIQVAGYVFPEPEDRNTLGDIYLVVSTPLGWFMRDTQGRFVPWSTRTADLIPAARDVVLSDPARLPVFTAALPAPGLYEFYVGYRRAAARYYAAQPVRITATN